MQQQQQRTHMDVEQRKEHASKLNERSDIQYMYGRTCDMQKGTQK
jgi:hypothetical protein